MAFNFLIVDDSDTIRAVIAKTLKVSGVPLGELHFAANGQEALDSLKENWVDIVLTDINMPDINGLELIRFIRDNERYRETPLIIISTETSQRDRERGLALGANAYLVKPFEPSALKEVVER